MWNHQKSNWDEVVNGSTVEKSVDPETERPPPDGEPGADENEQNSSDKEEEKESGKEKEPGEEQKELGEGVELETHCSRCPCYPNQCPLRRLLHSQHSPPA